MFKLQQEEASRDNKEMRLNSAKFTGDFPSQKSIDD